MLKYIVKYIRRSAVTNTLFCLLLMLAGTLLCITAGLWYSAHKALLDINETITTIAIPNQPSIHRLAVELVEQEHRVIIAEAVELKEYEILKNIREQIYTSGSLHMDERRIFNAFAEGVAPLILRTRGVGAEPFIAANSGQVLAAFFVTCEMIRTEHSMRYDWIDGEVQANVVVINEARFLVNEVLLLHHIHSDPKYISINFILNHDGSPPFERGKQYVVFGNFDNTFFGMDKLTLETPNVETTGIPVGSIYNNDEVIALLGLSSNFMWSGFQYLDESYFPMDIVDYSFAREPGINDGWYSFLDVESSLEETMASAGWQPMQEAMNRAEMSMKSFQVITTDNPNSLPRFNQNRNLFDEGRTFTQREVSEGARVCLISKEFAEHNELSVGDTIPLQLYNTVLGSIYVTYMVSDGIMATGQFWIPGIYREGLEISAPEDFEIVGIYNTIIADRSEYAIPANTVIIPNSSFGELEGEPFSQFDTSIRAPILLNSMIAPNGRINETRDIINSIVPGYGGLFRFYDQGYDSLRTTLGNLRFGLTWILALTITGWLAVLFIFLMFYVTRKRKEGALLYAIGVSRAKRFIWVFTQCAVLILVALGISIAVSLPLYGDILDVAGGAAQEFTDSFRNLTLSEAADSGIRSRIPLDRSRLALLITVAGASVITLVAAALLTKRSAAFKSLGEKRGVD